MVLYNHRPSFTWYENVPVYSFRYCILVILSLISRCGPVVFFMISGILLLGKNESIFDIIKKRLLRMIIVMIGLALYATWIWGTDDNFFIILFTRLNWYLYAYCAYLIMLPLIRRMCIGLSVQEIKYFIIVAFFFYFVDGLLGLHGLYNNISMYSILFTANWASNCWHVLFPVLGFVLIDLYKRERKNVIIFCLFVCFINIITTIVEVGIDITNNYQNVEMILQRNVFGVSCGVIVLVYELLHYFEMNKIVKKLIAEISGCTFGIFLIETHTSCSAIIFEKVQSVVCYNNYVISVISIIFELIIYFILIYILRLIPFVRKII